MSTPFDDVAKDSQKNAQAHLDSLRVVIDNVKHGQDGYDAFEGPTRYRALALNAVETAEMWTNKLIEADMLERQAEVNNG